MNSFANSLFSLLFGWARSIIQQVWTSSASGHFGSFFSWLGSHWLWLAAALALAGTIVDMLVWLCRWKPYLIWKTNARRVARWFSSGHGAPHRRFEKGYQGGVAIEMPKEEAPKEPAEAEWKEPVWPEGSVADQGFFTHSFTEALARDAVLTNTEKERQGKTRPSSDSAYEPPAAVTESWLNTAYPKAKPPVAQRKRRSGKNEKKKPAWANKLMIPEVEEESLLDGLPPAVDRHQAFHEPVYPMQNHMGADTGWQPSVSGQPAEGNYRR